MHDVDFLPRHELCVSFTRLLMVVLALATVGRPLVVSMDPLFTYVGLFNVALCGGVYGLLRWGRLKQWEGLLVLILGMILILPLLTVSGGINSQFAYLIPIYPLAAIMLSGNRLALTSCALWIALILVFLYTGPAMMDLTGEAYHHAKTVSRAVWLMFGLLMATGFGAYFQKACDRLARQLHEQATFDHLTGVVNRRALEAVIDREIKRVRRTGTWLSLMMVDVDHFKQFNDRHGHATGDRCLVDIAGCLRRCTRDGQDVVGRYGGEEFIVVLTDTDPAAAARVAEKLRRAVAALRPGTEDEHLSVTIGISSTRDPMNLDRQELIRRADVALYAGKTAGRDRVTHFPVGRSAMSAA